MRRDKHNPWNKSTLLEDELDALGYQWSTSRIQQSDLALGTLCKRDAYNSSFENIRPDRCMKILPEKISKKFSEKLVFIYRERGDLLL